MSLWQAPLDGSSIHLAVEASSGGSSLGIQMARQAIADAVESFGPPRNCRMV